MRTPQPDELAAALREQAATVDADRDGALLVSGADAADGGPHRAGRDRSSCTN